MNKIVDLRNYNMIIIAIVIVYMAIFFFMIKRMRRFAKTGILTASREKITEQIKHKYIKFKSRLISIKYKIYSKIEKSLSTIKKFFKRSKAQLFFFLFYIPYIAFFVFLVIFQRMQEADVAFKYIVFPLYFAVPILFKSAFDRLGSIHIRRYVIK